MYDLFSLEMRFTRIDEAKWTKSIKNDRLKNQSYLAKKGDNFAYKAANDLIRVRGKDFRKEMQKKKRASWKGNGKTIFSLIVVPTCFYRLCIGAACTSASQS